MKSNKRIKFSGTALLFILACCMSDAGAQGFKQPASSRQVKVYTTAQNTNYRLTPTDTVSFKAKGQPFENEVIVFVDPSKTFQSLLGIGGAITDASAETWAKLPAPAQQQFIRAYYDKENGIGYTLARTNIHSCDFSSDTYTYIQEGDSSLKTFSIAHDKQYRIPMIKSAIAAAGGKLTLFASPWSPPAFMKDNNDILHGGSLKKGYYQSWANYFTRFIRAYEAEGIPVWGVSIQNEPMAKQKWESCIYTASQENDFLKNYLGPTMQKAGLANKKIIGWDHNRDLLYQRAGALLDDAAAAKYLWGIGFHWYEPWSGGEPMYDNVKLVHDAFPKTNLLFTEGCKEAFDLNKVYDWALGEKYGSAMIRDFNNGSCGFTDWNVLLDEHGGPNHVGNFCFAPIHADTQKGELIFTNEYYYIGHFSKFIRPGAKRIIASASRSQLLTTAFKNTDGSIAVVVMNQGDAKTSYYLWIDGKAAMVNALPHSIATMVF